MAYYLAQSERMQQLFRFAQFGGPLAMVLAVGIVFAIGVSALGLETAIMVIERTGIIATTIITVVVWMVLVFMVSVFAARDKPYGVRLFQVLVLFMQGLFRPDIRDYDPDEELPSARAERSRK
jgi:hypothetical protein